jgi:hypothetical protein
MQSQLSRVRLTPAADSLALAAELASCDHESVRFDEPSCLTVPDR